MSKMPNKLRLKNGVLEMQDGSDVLECQHKVPVCVYCEGTGIDPESFRSPAELVCPACSVPDNAVMTGPQAPSP